MRLTPSVVSSFVIVATAAAIDESSPPNVAEKNMSSIFDIISRFPTRADNGYPFAMALPNAARSGVTL